MFLKSNRKIRFFLLITLILLSGIGFYFLEQKKIEVDKVKNQTQSLLTFNQKIIPLYQEKRLIIKSFFPDSEKQGNLKPILDLIEKWDAKSQQDIKDIVEIAGFLDQRLNTAMKVLNPNEKELLIKKLEPIERKIRQLDETYHQIPLSDLPQKK